MQDKILIGPTTPYMATMGVGEYFWRTAENYGERICQIDAYTHKKESFKTVLKRALRVAIQLRKMGVQPKDLVMFSCLNDMDNIVPPLAALFLGAQVCSTGPLMELFDVKYLLTQVKPKVIFVVEKNLNMIEEAVKSLGYQPQICVIGKSEVYAQMYEMEKTETVEEKCFKPVKVDVKETAFIVFSSGTTSLPKGVCMSHISVMSVACHQNVDQISPNDDPIIKFSTLSWVSGIWIFSFCLIYAQPYIVGPDISAIKFLELVDTYKINHGFIYGHVLYDLVNMDKEIFKKYNVSSITNVFMGGTSIDPEVILQLRKLFPGVWIAQSYAATELGITATTWMGADKNDYENKISSVGRPSWNVKIKIVDVETREPLGANQQGEVLVNSPYRMNGFCNKDSSEVFDKENYLKTGDLGYYDEGGYLYIVDRLNDIFKFCGQRVAPTMIETVLMKHTAIKEAVVFGVPHPADYYHPAAFIVLQENLNASAQDIYDFVKTNMSDMHLLRGGIKFLKDIPKINNGKVSRNALKKLFLSSD